MVVGVKIGGAKQLRALGADLKAAGEEGKGLRRELLRNMRLASKPMVEEVRSSARSELPKGGGLNEYIATSKISARNSLVGKRVGTRIVMTKPGGKHGKHDLNRMDAGSLRHPYWGRWVKGAKTQKIPSGWFEKPIIAAQSKVRLALLMAMSDTKTKLKKR